MSLSCNQHLHEVLKIACMHTLSIGTVLMVIRTSMQAWSNVQGCIGRSVTVYGVQPEYLCITRAGHGTYQAVYNGFWDGLLELGAHMGDVGRHMR